jgi:hypothetical protein
MKPRPYVQLQAVAVLLIATATLGVLGDEAALAIALALSLGTTIWVFFALRYGWLRSRSDLERSGHRASGDAAMVICLVVGLLIPGACAWIVTIGDLRVIDPPLHGAEAGFAALSVLLIPLSILVSSSVDWYLIRAFREGVHDTPPCQPEVQQTSRPMDYARYWIMHRMLAEFLAYAGVSLAIAMAVTIAGNAAGETGENVLNVVGAAGVLGWSLAELGKLRSALDFVRYPTCGLASWVRGRNANGDDISGFVLDVSIDPGVQLIEEPRGHPAQDIALQDRSVPLRQRRTIKQIAPPRSICPGGKCEFWIPDCEAGLRELEAKQSAGEAGDIASLEPSAG